MRPEDEKRNIEDEGDDDEKAARMIEDRGIKHPLPTKEDMCRHEKIDKPYHPDPPEHPKDVYATEGRDNGPVAAHPAIAGGAEAVRRALAVGRKVTIDNLDSDEGQKLNGQTGRILARDDATGEFTIQTEDGTKAKVPEKALTPEVEDEAGKVEAARFAEATKPRPAGMTNP